MKEYWQKINEQTKKRQKYENKLKKVFEKRKEEETQTKINEW